jgi:hypothetical protein
MLAGYVFTTVGASTMTRSSRRRSTSMLKRVLGLLLPVVLLSCSDGFGPEPTFWTYNLVSVNGSAPYQSKSQIATGAEEVDGGAIGLNEDGTWNVSITVFVPSDGQPITLSTPRRAVSLHGTWTRNHETFTLRDSDDGSTMTATHAPSFLTVVRGSDTLGFELVCWHSCMDFRGF